MPSITASAKWFVFAVAADDRRRAAYGRWIDGARRSEIAARRAALRQVPSPTVDIPGAIGHRRCDASVFLGVDSVVAEVRRLRATTMPATDEKPYLIDYAVTEHDLRSPLLRFALSDEVIAPASHYLGMVPILTMITVLASPCLGTDVLSGSQLFHSDWEDRRQVKVFVHCSDVGAENGPLTAVTAAASSRIKDAVGYHYGGPDFRVPDDDVLPRTAADEVTAFVGPESSVTFIDTSSCLHFGSRVQRGAAERLVVQFQYLTPSAFDLQLAGRRGRPFSAVTGGLSATQRLVLGAKR
jgi:hypothetical protein